MENPMTNDLKELIARHRKSADAVEHDGFTGLADQMRDVADALEAATAPNIEPLRQSGFAPGSYFCFCADCGKQHTADKLAWRCLDCAEKRVAATAKLCAVVKPLEWEGDGFWSSGPNEGWLEETVTPFGWGYSVEFGSSCDFVAESGFGETIRGMDTPDEAKAAAQADYERRILSAITIPSASDVAAEARAETIEAAKDAVDKENRRRLGLSSLRIPAIADELQQALNTIHDTDTQAAIERIKEQARQEERERLTDIISMYPKPHSNRIIAAIMEGE